MKIFNLKLLSMLILFFVVNPTLYSDTIEDSLNENIPKVYINCEWCDMDFIKTEIQFVNYVIDRTVADIHVLITTQTTGSGGTEYTITFIGQHNYKGLEDTLKFVSERLATDDTIRRGIVKLLKLGLMRYIAKTPIADKISISYAKEEKSVPTADRWKNWVFSIGVKGYFNGEQLTKYNSINGSFSANRTTENWKIRFYPNYNYTESSFKINDTTTVYSNSKSYGASISIVKSINDHWSISGGHSVYSSTYNNMKVATGLSPAIEYNIFPYSQSTSRELRILYSPGYSHNQYYEETIFNKMHENLLDESISITLDTKQRWGSISTTLSGSHYFHDFTKNNLSLWSTLSLRMIKGFSFSISGFASMVHDQLSLPKRDLAPEEIMLQIKQLASQYNYYFSVGLNYSFGSLYSNVVNPRMGG